jgi:drug/metabolite transporter (DMT)-like permease
MLSYWIFVFSAVGFMQTLRYGQQHGGNVLGLVAVNYVIALIGVTILATLRVRSVGLDMSGVAIAGGFVSGTVYFLHLITQLSAFKTSGVGIISAANRSAIVVPAVVAWACWGETMTVYRWLALAMIPPAMFLMRPAGSDGQRITFKAEALLIGCFLFGSVIGTLFKAVDVYLDAAQQETYKVALFATAFVWTCSTAIIRRIPLTRRDVAAGALLGVFNTLNLISVLLALVVIPAVILYPTSGCLMICINVILGRWLWKETLSRRQVKGLLLALAIVLLTTL